MQCTVYLSPRLTSSWSFRPYRLSAMPLPPFPTVSSPLSRSLSQFNGRYNSESNKPRDRSILENERHSRFSAEIRSRGVGRFFAHTIRSYPDHEMTLVKKREKERAREREKEILFLFLLRVALSRELPPYAHVRTHARLFARTSDRSRASFEKQCKRERHAGFSFLPTFLLTHVVPGSCSLPVPPSPLLSLSVHIVVSLSLSFPLHRMYTTLVHHRSFSFSPPLSFSLDLWCLYILYPCRFFSLLLHRRDIQPSSFNILADDLLVPVFLKCSPSFLSRPCLPRSILAPVQFNPFISCYVFKQHGRRIYNTIRCFPQKLVYRSK